MRFHARLCNHHIHKTTFVFFIAGEHRAEGVLFLLTVFFQLVDDAHHQTAIKSAAQATAHGHIAP